MIVITPSFGSQWPCRTHKADYYERGSISSAFYDSKTLFTHGIKLVYLVAGYTWYCVFIRYMVKYVCLKYVLDLKTCKNLFFLTGLCHENTWIGLNDRMVEDDFQWTDNMDLVSLAQSV